VKFSVQQEDLAHGLRTVGRAVATRTTLPILSGVLVETNESYLRLAATDLEISIEAFVPASIERSGAIVLPAHYFAEIVHRLPGGTVEVEVQPDQYTVQIRWQRSQFMIHGSAPDQFPALPTAGGEPELVFRPELLRELIRQTMFAVSSDETRPMLTGVQLNLTADTAYAIATDGFRIAYRQGKLLEQGTVEETLSLVIPGRALRELNRLLAAASASGDLFLDKNQVAFKIGETRFFSRLLEGEYPRVLELIPREYGTILVLSTQEFHDACERAALISDSRQRSQAIKLEIRENTLIITSNAPDVGQVYEELAAEVEGDGLTIAFNARFLIEGLRQIDTEQVRFDISGPLSPSRLSPVGHSDFFYVVLPMRNA